MKLSSLLLAGALALAMLVGPAFAAGLYTNGLPLAVPPFTGDETFPADTNLPSGLNPATEAVSFDQLSAFTGANGVAYASNSTTSAANVTTSQLVGSTGGSPLVVLDMTGSIGGALALTTPTAAAAIAASPGLQAGKSYVFRVINRTAATNAWTLTAGDGNVTVTGGAVAAATYRDFMVSANLAVSPQTVTFRSIGAGTN